MQSLYNENIISLADNIAKYNIKCAQIIAEYFKSSQLNKKNKIVAVSVKLSKSSTL